MNNYYYWLGISIPRAVNHMFSIDLYLSIFKLLFTFEAREKRVKYISLGLSSSFFRPINFRWNSLSLFTCSERQTNSLA